MRALSVAVAIVALVPVPARASTPGREISRQSLTCGVNAAIGCQDDTEQEPHLAINPIDAENAVAVVQQGRYVQGASHGIAYAVTFDGGEHWTGGTLPGLTTGALPSLFGGGPPWDRASDPVVAFDRKHGVVLAQSLVVGGPPIYAGIGVAEHGIAVNRSLDGGRTFESPVMIHVGPGDDKNWIAVDNTSTSPFYGRAYAAWNSGFAISDDGGLTWATKTEGWYSPIILVHPSGRITIIDGGVSADVSDDGGMTWRRAGGTGGSGGLERIASGIRDYALPSAAIDPDSGEIVAAWQEADGFDETDDIALARSSDSGATWSEPVIVTAADPPTVAHFTPAVAIDGSRVYVTYRRRAAGPGVLVDMVMQTSADGGATFGPPVLLAEPSVMAFAPVAHGSSAQPSLMLGEYMGLAAVDGRWYAAWPQAGAYVVDGTPGRTHQRLYAAVGVCSC